MAEKSERSEDDSKVNTIHQNLDVYIWDMDETLILLNSLLKESYAVAFNGLKDVKKGVEIGKMWEKLILQLCDDYFFYEQVNFGFFVEKSFSRLFQNINNLTWDFFIQIENYNQPFLDALNQYDDGRDLSDYDFNQDDLGPPHDVANKRKLAYRHRVIARKYIEVKINFSSCCLCFLISSLV